MAGFKKIPQPLTVLIIVTIIAALASWLLPAGAYDKLAYNEGTFKLSTTSGNKTLPFTQHTLDSLHILIKLEKFQSGDIRKPVAVPGTYHQLPPNRQGLISLAEAPVKGINDAADIIFFLLIIGGFISVFEETGAMARGMIYLSHRMKGKEDWLIISITFFFAFFGSADGMEEEAMIFYPILVPLLLAAGYDLLVPVAVIFAGTNVGRIASFCNPFSTIIASNAAGINWKDGLYERIIVFVVVITVSIGYIVRYAQKVKKDPKASFVYRFDGHAASPYPGIRVTEVESNALGFKNSLLIILFISTILVMIGGVVFLDWWLLEMSVVFLVSSVLIAVIAKMPEKLFIDRFVKGMQSLLSVLLIIGVARGVTIVLNDGRLTDTILYYSANLVGTMPPVLFIVVLLLLYMMLSLFISSTSGMAMLTMPIFGSLALIVGVPGREIVNAYIFGMGITSFLTPTGIVLPSLALANVSIKAWLRFSYPLLIMLFVICAVFLITGVLSP